MDIMLRLCLQGCKHREKESPEGSHLSPKRQITATVTGDRADASPPFLTLNQHCPWLTDLNVFSSLTFASLCDNRRTPQQMFKNRNTEGQGTLHKSPQG